MVCGLCGQEKPLLLSHLIPKFATNWIKETSATPFMRKSIDPSKRIQDGPKSKKYCSSCELLLSKNENYFAKTIFYPWVNKGQQEFSYDDRLMKFVIGVSWRVLDHHSNEEIGSFQPNVAPYLFAAREHWKSLLLNDTTDTLYQHHIFFISYLTDGPSDNLLDLQFYFMRGIDATFVANSSTAWVFSKLPGVAIISCVHPKENDKFVNTKIGDLGVLSQPQKIDDPYFGEFLINRAESLTKNKMSIEESMKMFERMLKDPNKVARSKTFETWYYENQRQRNRKQS